MILNELWMLAGLIRSRERCFTIGRPEHKLYVTMTRLRDYETPDAVNVLAPVR